MNSLILDKTQDTPGIILDKKSGIFSFEGASIPENVKTFYKPVIEWVEEYTNNPNKETVLNFKMDYFNTSSTKILLDLMIMFKEISKNGKMLIINWYFEEEDEDMLEAGDGFSKMLRFPFNFIKR